MSKVVNLTAHNAAILHQIFNHHIPRNEPWRVLAYGSRVIGNFHSGSDLDLVIQNAADPQRRFPDIDLVTEAITDSDVTIMIDFFDYARLPEAFHDQIDRTSAVFWPVSGR